MTARLNILVGPPSEEIRDKEAIEFFLQEAETRVVCGGSTTLMLSRYMNIEPSVESEYPEEGLMSYGYMGDIVVTEGVVTLRAVADYLKGYRARPVDETGAGKLIALFEKADEVRIAFGTAKNPRHFGVISFARKNESLELIKEELEKRGKKVEIVRF